MEPPEYAPGTSEIGSLTAHSNEDSQFVGSSSGVYFINTVKRAFSNGHDESGSRETEFPTAEDTLVGVDDSSQQKRRRTESRNESASFGGEPSVSWKYDPALASSLGTAPPPDVAKEFMMSYFKVWHPLFPFLHGPTFLQAMEKLYSNSPMPNDPVDDSTSEHRATCWTIILQCIFNLGSLLHPDLQLPNSCKIQSPSCMTPLLSILASRHDIVSLQALLAIQVYLVATMSLRLASTFGGCILRSMLHAGLHRCPFRYSQLSSHDRQLRKRIFWCAYAIDRYLSQALGLPLGIQDLDVDVCLPAAPEMHSPRLIRDLSMHPANLDYRGTTVAQSPSLVLSPSQQQTADHRKKESVLASYVDSGTLTGRALELFHKSILVRSVRRSSVLFLVTDVHKWWNSLPLELQGKVPGCEKEIQGKGGNDDPFDFGPFFTVLYQHLILIIHRPSLSLNPSTAEFCSGLQTCIGAARGILAALKTHLDSRQAFFWPGFLSAAWMSGLVLAFACQLKQYVLSKGLQEIDDCAAFLRHMSSQWETARPCHHALTLLSSKIKQMGNEQRSVANSHAYVVRTPDKNDSSVDPVDREGYQVKHMNPAEGHHTEAGYASVIPEPRPEINPMPSRYNESENDCTPAEDLGFQNEDAGYLAGGSSFDLNMVDLLDGADFNSLFDLIGQQYPSF
ncbi:uncharacterized protein N7484_009979 [Penicillium longicatenatum]|uniref:uncharacterized protein n=1 Tax=Penicillium longicatenatum TaxID=1561947 RepID=UPI002548F4C9|nr:uncharacterized protein N7484_009979 [Penicillium longicatenatum]KAJ5636666.1 hypothetical protein N7484_009979 [Penicillium longicatenatum]